MARAIWKGSLAFGLVNIPVELFTAVRDSRPRFRLLHRKDESPVQYQRVCQREGKPLSWEEIVKGYEYSKGHYVVLTKDDFETAAMEKSKVVNVVEFVDTTAIDDRFFEQPYYLAPAKGSERAYAVLREALRKSGKAGIATMILREKQHLCAIEVSEKAMVLTMMRFAEELVDVSDLSLPSKELVKDKELDLAMMLIDSLTSDWAPDKYKDEYRENLMKVIKAKLKGKEPKLTATDHVPGQAEVIDLMERLRESLGASKTRAKAASQSRNRSSRSSARKRTTASAKRSRPAAARARKATGKRARKAA
jgi:DNA end-binding protein Ku